MHRLYWCLVALAHSLPKQAFLVISLLKKFGLKFLPIVIARFKRLGLKPLFVNQL